MILSKKVFLSKRMPYTFSLHYRPQRSCGQGNIFTPVCHSVHRGGALPQCMLGYQHPPDHTPPPPEQTPPPPREADSSIRSTSGRYASYWNAFLLYICFITLMVYFRLFVDLSGWCQKYDVAMRFFLFHSMIVNYGTYLK